MPAVWLRFRAELRTRWRTALGLALLVGLAGGIVLTAVAGARRTDWAYPRMAGGRWAWSVLASNIGFLSEPAVAWLAVALALPVLVVGANAVAAVPAWFAGRTRPAVVLRSE